MWYLHNSHNTRGQVLPLVAICLAVLMGFAGMAIDVGFAQYQQRQQQNATDAAAIGGAQQMIYSGCGTGATTAADNDAATNGYTNGSNGVTVTVSNPPSSGPYASNNCAVQVQITNSNTKTFFMKLFGKPSLPESTTAVAEATAANGSGCMYFLSTSVETNFNGANVQSPGCGVLINDTANFNGATMDALSIGYAGAAPNENGATFKLAQPTPMLAVANPCPEIAGCAYIAANAPSTSSCSDFNGNGWSGTLTPGCYDNLNLNGATVTLNGLYIFNGPTNFNGATVTSGPSGATMIVTANGTPPNFNGDNISLSAPTTGNYAGVLYYQVPANTQSPNFNGSSNYLSGLVYAPTATSVNFNGSGGGYLVFVVGAANLNGSSAQEYGKPPTNGSLIKTAVLVE
jgi:Putative Flp pilus-assembly TadE/G-like